MKYVLLASFKADFKRLTPAEQELFSEAVRKIDAAFSSFRRKGGEKRLPQWPAALRIKPIAGAPGIWEMTWSFSGPDGRATFELVDIEGEPAIRWRRIGDHKIFREP